MLKIHILYEYSADLRPHGSSYIRLLQPLTHPSISKNWKISYSIDYYDTDVDIVIVDRMWRPDVNLTLAGNLIKRIRKRKALFIYSIDDNLLDLEVYRAGFIFPNHEQKMVVRLFAREADAIIVSTSRLKERFSRFNKNIIVIPNALDERLFNTRHRDCRIRSSSRGKKTLGYMGTYTHDNDLMMILLSLREVLRSYRDEWEIEIVGVISEPNILQAFQGLPVRVLDTSGHAEYPHFVLWMQENIFWDLAIAPLEDNVFTRCKSDIKFLDYSMLGIPGIYSQVPAYEGIIKHLETGYLADNNPEAWTESLKLLMTNDTLRQKLARQAQEYVVSNRTLKYCAQNWQNAILSLIEQQ